MRQAKARTRTLIARKIEELMGRFRRAMGNAVAFDLLSRSQLVANARRRVEAWEARSAGAVRAAGLEAAVEYFERAVSSAIRQLDAYTAPLPVAKLWTKGRTSVTALLGGYRRSKAAPAPSRKAAPATSVPRTVQIPAACPATHAVPPVPTGLPSPARVR